MEIRDIILNGSSSRTDAYSIIQQNHRNAPTKIKVNKAFGYKHVISLQPIDLILLDWDIHQLTGIAYTGINP